MLMGKTLSQMPLIGWSRLLLPVRNLGIVRVIRILGNLHVLGLMGILAILRMLGILGSILRMLGTAVMVCLVAYSMAP